MHRIKKKWEGRNQEDVKLEKNVARIRSVLDSSFNQNQKGGSYEIWEMLNFSRPGYGIDSGRY
jgi:hypothetical protein